MLYGKDMMQIEMEIHGDPYWLASSGTGNYRAKETMYTNVNSDLSVDIHNGEAIGLVIESHCNYFAPVTFPEPVTAGLCVSKLGNSSVRYEVGIFRGDEDQVAAQGHFVHVYVDRLTRKPISMPAATRALLGTITL
jgi:acyl-CoA thioesterase FadM